MKKFRHIIFMFAVVLGLAFSVSAQKGGGQRPPKDPPRVDPGEKKQPPPKGNPPKERPGRPGMAFIAIPSRDEHLG